MQMQMILPQLELHRIETKFENMPHVHEDQFQLTIPVQGTCFFTHENKELTLAPGNGLFIHPNDKHSFHIGPDASVIIIRVHDQSLHPKAISERREPALRQQFDLAELGNFFRKWAAGMFNLDRADQMAVEELESQILDYLQGLLWGGASEAELKQNEASLGPLGPHYTRVLEYIHTHYSEQMNIDTLASIALQSRFYFIRSFKSVTGLTPYQYVLQLRVKKAMEQLQRSAATVTDISFSLGFSSTSQFYRIFSKIVEMTPEQYRNEQRGY